MQDGDWPLAKTSWLAQKPQQCEGEGQGGNSNSTCADIANRSSISQFLTIA
jgi:hypothetical protein